VARVFIPSALRHLSGGETSVESAAPTLRTLIEELDERFPGMADALLEDGEIRPAIAVFIDTNIADRGLYQQIPPGAEVHFLPAVSGGAPSP